VASLQQQLWLHSSILIVPHLGGRDRWPPPFPDTSSAGETAFLVHPAPPSQPATPLPTNGTAQLDGGLKKKILVAGSGWEKPEKGDSVTGERARGG